THCSTTPYIGYPGHRNQGESVRPPTRDGRQDREGSSGKKQEIGIRGRASRVPFSFSSAGRGRDVDAAVGLRVRHIARTPDTTTQLYPREEYGDGTYQRHREVVLPGEGLWFPSAGGRAGRFRAPQRHPGLGLQGPVRGRGGRVRGDARGQGAEG